MTDYWLIRNRNNISCVWKRQYMFGLIAIPWALHGGTRIVFTPDKQEDTVQAAIQYIRQQSIEPVIMIQYKE